MPAAGLSPREPPRGLLLAAGIVVLVFLVYAPALTAGFTDWDDPTYVAENPLIRDVSLTSFARWWTEPYFANYAPLTLASYALDHALWGLRPFGYHLTNVLLHAVSSALLLGILMALGAPARAAWLGAAIFALHPAQAESVAWIAQRKTVLAMLFLLLSFRTYIRATREEPASPGGLAASFALFLAALLSKVSVVAMPGVFFLYDLGFRRGRPARMLIEKIPFLAAAAAAAYIGFLCQQTGRVLGGGWIGGSPALHLATVGETFARYLRVALFPTGLSALYGAPDAVSPAEPLALAGYAVFLAGAASFLWAWRANRRALVWLGFVWLGFLPVSQIVSFSLRMADRYLSIPLLGIAAGAGFGFAALEGRLRPGTARRGARVAAAIALACLALLASARARVWRDPFSLWADTVAKPPVAWMAWYNHGKVLERRRDPDAAIASYRRALDRNPESNWSLINLAGIHAGRGEAAAAEALLREAMDARYAADPDKRALAATNLGALLESLGRFDAAMSAYQSAIAMAPEDPAPRARLGVRLRAMGRGPEARRRFEQALAREPGNATADIGLAGLDADAGRLGAARKRLDAVIAREPDNPDALLARARVESKAGDPDAARADLDRALELAPPGALRREILETRDKLPGGGAAR